MDNLHQQAGECFCLAAEMALRNDEKDDAANDFWAASKAYKKSNPERASASLFSLPLSPPLSLSLGDEPCIDSRSHTVAVAALQKTIQLYKEKGRFRQAADRHKEIAAILQQEGGDLAGSLEAYEAAGDIYMNEDAAACVPHLALSLPPLPRARRPVKLTLAPALSLPDPPTRATRRPPSSPAPSVSTRAPCRSSSASRPSRSARP